MDYNKFLNYLQIVADAHQNKTKPDANKFRIVSDGEKIPYFFHSLWCAVMIYMEPTLNKDIRTNGAIALLFHDYLEDTTASLPEKLPDEAKKLIESMTIEKEAKYDFSRYNKEKVVIFDEEPMIRLLKLYDKVATLYDGDLEKERYTDWSRFVNKLADDVEKNYGNLNIVMLGRQLAAKYISGN
jgi:hypothetical protein